MSTRTIISAKMKGKVYAIYCHHDSLSDAVKNVIDNYPAGHQFFGNELHDDVARVYPQSARQYPDTILRMARRHRRGAFRVVNQNKSLYEKV